MEVLVYEVKSVGALEIEFVAPIPEQNAIIITHYGSPVTQEKGRGTLLVMLYKE